MPERWSSKAASATYFTTRAIPTHKSFSNATDLVDIAPGCIFKERCDRAFSLCDVETPDRHEVGGGHQVACHLLAAEAVDA
jgi:oligopeptide/dipeptide ABC transporter ATP-binding protein